MNTISRVTVVFLVLLALPWPVSAAPDKPWPGHAVCYGPHRDGQRPGGPGPTTDQIREDLELIQRRWSLLRMYGARGPAETVLELIRDNDWDLKVMVGAWIAPDDSASNRAEIEAAAELAHRFPDQVWAVCVGNETQVSWSAHRTPLPVLLQAIDKVRAALGPDSPAPVTVADDYQFWLTEGSAALDDKLDFLVVHAHPMWNGKQLDEALPWVQEALAKVQAVHPGKTLVLGETGWATDVADHGEQARLIKGRPGVEELATYFQAVRDWSRSSGRIVFFFEAFDENWKGGDDPREVEKHWGVYTADRLPKFVMEE